MQGCALRDAFSYFYSLAPSKNAWGGGFLGSW